MTTQIRRALPRLAQLDQFGAALGGAVSRGGARLVLSELHNLRCELLRGIVIEPGIGLGGRALECRRPVAVEDYLESTTITHQFDRAVAADQLRAAIALPVRVQGAVRAVVYGAARAPTAFGDRTVDAAMAVTRQLAHDIAVEEQVQRRLERILQEQRHRARGDLAPLTGRDVAELNAELVAIAAAVADPDLRERLVALSDRLSGGETAQAARAMVRLSRREADVLIQLAAGCTNREIADRLSILPTTVKTHLKNAMRKLGARNRVEAVSAARHAGLLR
ncbi:MAG: LuxR C-terminal-related transcriptional regulator [Micromonosporaceae bacterium]